MKKIGNKIFFGILLVGAVLMIALLVFVRLI